MSPVNWEQLFRVRLAHPEKESMDFHDVIKLLLVRKLIQKNKSIKNWIRIYTEFVIKEGKLTDIYFENIKTKSAYIYEVQKQDSSKWEKEITDFYKDFNVEGMNTTDLIIVRLKKLSKNLDELDKQLEEFVI